MELIFDNDGLHIFSEKKEILLTNSICRVDGMPLEIAWEYEKWGFLCYAYESSAWLVYRFQIEGKIGAYITSASIDSPPELMDFLGDIDILFVTWGLDLKSSIEKIEPRMIIALWEQSASLASALGASLPVDKYKLKESDFSPENTPCVLMA